MGMSKTERIAHFSEATGLGSLIRRLGTWNGILVLTYHRIGFVNDSYDSGVVDASPAVFEEQLRFLKKEYDVIGPDELETAVNVGRGRYVLLTFDDGYSDNFDEAFPILKRHGVPATFFVTTAFLDNRQIAWWDEIAWMVHASPRCELHVNRWSDGAMSLNPPDRKQTSKNLIDICKSLPLESAEAFLDSLAEATESGRHQRGDGQEFWMSWDEVRQLRDAGMHIGGHTINHPMLARLPVDEQEREIVGCKDRLEAELGEPMRYFSYPYGSRDSFNENTRRILAEHGVDFAFSFYNGYRRFTDWDPYDVRRRCLGLKVSAQRVALMLTVPQVFAGR
jgi:peptidoglycan/xylan/chitin deacetylase (PgdA/CDA1 family)